MYLVSLYFDEKTERRVNSLIEQVARKTGNSFMTDGHVPPHITVCEFESQRKDEAIACLRHCAASLNRAEIQFVSVGTFFPYVIYLAPLLDKNLLEYSEVVCSECAGITDSIMSRFYRPFQWMPHATIGKKLSKEEMRVAFEVLQNQFAPFQGSVTRIGLAKTNPYEDLAVFELPARMNRKV